MRRAASFAPVKRCTRAADSATWAQPTIVGNRMFVKDTASLALWIWYGYRSGGRGLVSWKLRSSDHVQALAGHVTLRRAQRGFGVIQCSPFTTL